MFRSFLTLSVMVLAASFASFNTSQVFADEPAPEGTAEKIGEKIDRGLTRLGNELRRGWQEARDAVDKLGIEGRVYGRLKWDKRLENAPIEIDSRETGVVVLTGTVTNMQAKSRAGRLAEDTVGVRQVVNNITVAAPEAAPLETAPATR